MICQDSYICLLGLTVLLQITSFPTVWDLNMITPVFQMSCWTQSTIMIRGTLTKEQDCQFGSCPNSNLNNYNLLLLFLFFPINCNVVETSIQLSSAVSHSVWRHLLCLTQKVTISVLESGRVPNSLHL